MKWNEFHQAIFSTTVEVRTIECISDSSWLTREKKQTLSAMTMQKVETMTMQKIMQQIMQKMETMTMQKRGQVVFNWRAQFGQVLRQILWCVCAGLHNLWLPGSRAARKWRENKKMKRKWREIHSRHFLIFTLFRPSLSISYIKIVPFCCKMLNTALLSRMSQKS